MNDAIISLSHKVSVVVNVWGEDNAISLFRSLQSVLMQNRKPDEVLVVIDGPIPTELRRIIGNFSGAANFLVKQIEIPKAEGLWNARNIGIQAAEHEFIAVHDADDVMHNLIKLGIQKSMCWGAQFTSLMQLMGKCLDFDLWRQKVN